MNLVISGIKSYDSFVISTSFLTIRQFGVFPGRADARINFFPIATFTFRSFTYLCAVNVYYK